MRRGTPDSLADLIRAYLAAARSDVLLPAGAEPLRKSTLKSTTYQLNRLTAFLGPEAGLSDFDVATLRRVLLDMESRGLSAGSRRGAIFAWRRLGRWLVSTGRIDADPAQQVRLPKLGIARRTVCSDQMLRDLLEATGRIVDARRSTLARGVVSMLAYAGLRRTELLNLHVRDVDPNLGDVIVNYGKGGKSRRVPILEEGRQAIRDYLKIRGKCKHDFLWAGYDETRRLGDEGLRLLLREVAAIAGHRDDPGALPHPIRRNFATRLMRSGIELDAIREWLGHADIQTTAIYLSTGYERLREVADLAGLVREADKAQREEKKKDSDWRRAAWRRERTG